jgi:integrase
MTRKRGNNEGSIHKLPNGRWRGQVSHEGHRLSKVFHTQRECQEWVRKNHNQIEDGMTYTSTKLTLGEYMQGWLTNAKATKRRSTWIHYEQLFRVYITPHLGSMKLKDLRTDKIQGFYNSLLEKDVGVYTIRKIHAILHSALQQAVKTGSINRNPADFSDPPQKPIQEMAILNENQVSQMLVTAKGHRWEALYQLAIVTGMRESELLGLKWIDLDWIRHTLKIERQLQRPTGNGVEFIPPKTRYGKRSIALGQQTIQVLRAHYERQQAERLAAGETWVEYGLIFTTSNGTPIHQRNLQRDFKALIRQAGLPPIRFHDLRHTAASLMMNHDVPVIVVSRRLGHARASITMDVYGHLIPSMQTEAAELMDGLVTPIEVKLNSSTIVS